MSDTREDIKSLAKLLPSISLLDFALAVTKLPSIDEIGPDGVTLFYHTLLSKRWDLTRFLIDLGVNLNTVGNEMYAPLAFAITHDDRDLADTLLKAGADPNGTIDSSTFLYWAVCNSNVAIAKLMIDAGGDVSLGPTPPLYAAVCDENEEMVKLLLDSGADMNQKFIRGDLTSLEAAKKFGYTKIIDLFEQHERNT